MVTSLNHPTATPLYSSTSHMANAGIISYNVASFICALFALEFGADKFVDHTAVVADRTGIPEAVIGLLTAGAEWEELAVVIACMLQNRPSLAIGNIVGSCISNILGAFSLGLIFRNQEELIAFDASAKTYTLILFLLTLLFTGLVQWGSLDQTRTIGVILIVVFVVYVASVAYLIVKGRLTAPESDSDSESEGESIDSEDDEEEATSISRAQVNSTTPLLEAQQELSIVRQHEHSISYHVASLVFGFLAIVLSSFVLSNAASTIADQTGLSDVLFGVVFLSIATTLPEKFVAVVSGSRNRTGILVANTVGSNIFLLSLCMGVLLVSTAGTVDNATINIAELGVLVGSTLFMALTVWFGARWSRVAGMVMLIGYLAFLILEFTTIRHE
ncbi:hypothetical protein D6C78_02379 [Aureobasidium pullulans]|uniref:Sodium/calcium exchanger membrane region domain-containing protein n=1 Tax=Aureobasidium pullulans TaxID=5580 RepID=A0A4T0C757_AURPU|nr:hypothetical protein D6C78_02379 [Aureobasidium pullulans]